MKRISLLLSVFILSSIFISSCSTSSDVASNHRIQKRKYNRGFFIQKGASKSKIKKNRQSQDLLVEAEQVPEIIKRDIELTQIEPSFKEKPLSTQNQHHSEIDVQKTETLVKTKVKKRRLTAIERQAAKKVMSKTDFKDRRIQRKVLSRTIKKVSSEDNSDEIEPILLYILCFVFPPIAVGLATDWNTNDVILNIVLCLLCGLPGIIHALIVVSKNV